MSGWSRAVAHCFGVLILACASDPGYQGRSSKEWIDQLHSGDSRTRVVAAAALGKILVVNPASHDVVDALSIALRDTSDQVRLAAATALTAEGVSPLAALGGFHAILHDSAHAQMRQAMATLVGAPGPLRGRMLIVPRVESLSDPDPGVRAAAVESLTMLGSFAQREIGAIAAIAKDSDANVLEAVLNSLEKLHAPADITLDVSKRARC